MDKSSVAMKLNVMQCDDIGVMLSFEYTCPDCGTKQTYNGLEPYESYFSSTGFFPMTVKCDHCKEKILIFDSPKKSENED